MTLEEYFDFLSPDDIRLKGHRIGVESVLYEYTHNEKTPEEIAERFPSLTLEQVYATILYYLHNREQMERYLAQWLDHGRKMREAQARNPTPIMLKLRKIREELERTQAIELEPA